VQRKYFAIALEDALPGFSSIEYADWASFFTHLAKETKAAKWQGPLIIDELPYLITVSPELPSILQKFIDHDAKRAKLHVALCGSSQRMMQGAILNHSAPLYGRADEILKLGPISIGYMKEALKLSTPREMLQAYSIWGGVPRYWELSSKSKAPFLETVDQLALDPMGPLSEEPNRLLLEETPSALPLRPILDAIGQGAHRLSEVASRIEQPATSLSRPIQRLLELDLIRKELPYGANDHHSKKTLYKIKDPFLRFWFMIVAPRRSFLSQSTKSSRKKWLKEALPRLVSITWEELCQEAAPLLAEKWKKIPFSRAGRYWDRQGNEWDILAESETREQILIGEAKWTAKTPTLAYTKKVIHELTRKGIPPIERKTSARPIYILFLPEKPKGLTTPPDVRVFDAKQVIAVLK
jgi:AAA+ ATPase superfamily predicted ATPase